MQSTLEYQPDFARVRETWNAYWAGEMIHPAFARRGMPIGREK